MLVSVIVPAYNSEGSIVTCLKSIFEQSYTSIEVIVVNDGSSDNTEQIVRNKFGDSVILISQLNKGQAVARNVGIRAAKGEVIAFLDADDFWGEDFCLEVVSFFQSNLKAGAVMTGWRRHSGNGDFEDVPSLVYKCISEKKEAIEIDNFMQFWVEQGNIQTGAIAIRKSVVEQVGEQLENLRVSQDWEYWLWVSLHSRWGFIGKVLYHNNSRAAARSDWWLKYKKRRRMCPTVEEWQRRVVPRIKEDDMPWFKKIRGQVAASYAHNQLLASRYDDAMKTVLSYHKDMPTSQLNKLMFFSAKKGRFTWNVVCRILIFKELLKSFTLKFSS